MIKEFSYRGFSIEELKGMSLEKFAPLLPSRERRSMLRHNENIRKFLTECEKKIANGQTIRTHLRDLIIVPQMVGMKIEIYSGKEFFPVEIAPEMLGHRLGEFAITRKKVEHGAAGIGATRSSSFLSVK